MDRDRLFYRTGPKGQNGVLPAVKTDFTGLLKENQGNSFQGFIAGVLQRMAFTVIDERDIPRTHDNKGSVVIVLTVTFQNVVSLAVSVMNVPADFTSRLKE